MARRGKMCSWVLIKLTVSRQMPSPIISSVETADWIPDLVRICLPGTSKGPGIMVCLKLCRTALIGTRLRRTVGLTGELELTVIALAVGEAGVVGVPAVRRVAREDRHGPGSVKAKAMEGLSV